MTIPHPSPVVQLIERAVGDDQLVVLVVVQYTQRRLSERDQIVRAVQGNGRAGGRTDGTGARVGPAAGDRRDCPLGVAVGGDRPRKRAVQDCVSGIPTVGTRWASIQRSGRKGTWRRVGDSFETYLSADCQPAT